MKVGDKVVFFYFSSVQDPAHYSATVIEVLPPDEESPQPLRLAVEFPQEILDAGIAPEQSHSIETTHDEPVSGGWALPPK